MTTMTLNCNILSALRDAEQSKLARNPTWVAAVEKAYDWLLRQDSVDVTENGAVVVQSASRDVCYHVTGSTCQCEAATNYDHSRLCWHCAAAWLVRKCAELTDAGAVFPETAPATVVVPAPTPRRELPANDVVYAQGNVQVLRLSGKVMTFRAMRAGAIVVEQSCAPQSWRKTLATVIAQVA